MHAKFDGTKSRNCPKFAQLRCGLEWVLDLWPVLPKCVTCHLLAPKCQFQQRLRGALVKLDHTFALQKVKAEATGAFHVSWLELTFMLHVAGPQYHVPLYRQMD